MIRRCLIVALSLGLASPAFAGDLHDSGLAAVRREVAQQSQNGAASQPRVRHSYLWPGVILFSSGMALATYGFLHTTDGDFVEASDASKLSKTGLGISGLALAAGGGAIMLLGATHGPAGSMGQGKTIGLAKRVSW